MNRYLITFLGAILFLASCSNSQEKGRQEGAKSYATIQLKKQSIELESKYSTSLKGRKEVKLYPQVSGYLSKVLIDEGSSVKKGQLLFVIQQSIYSAALNSAKAGVEVAKAQLNTAQINFDSEQNLYENKVVSEAEYKISDAALKSAKANLLTAKAACEKASINYSYTELRSPVDGVIGKINYREGDLVNANIQNPLTQVASYDPMIAYFSIGQEKILDLLLQYGGIKNVIDHLPKLNLILPNGVEYTEKGTVKTISGIVDEQTGAVSVRAFFPNPNKVLLSGSNAELKIKNIYNDVILIPQSATYEIQNKTYVYKVVNGVTKSTIVEVSATNNGKNYIVKSGLKEGDIIISKGAGLVKENTLVKMN
jgi:membrane fusion protein (multidrug efflux system)